MTVQQLHRDSGAKDAALEELKAHWKGAETGGISAGFQLAPPCCWWLEDGRWHRVVWLGLEPHTGDDRWLIDVEGKGFGHYPTLDDALEGARKMRGE